MKKLKNMEESDFLKLFFAFFSLFFLAGAVCMPDRARMISGMAQILSQPCKIPTNYFSVGGFSATLLNMGLVSLMCLGLYVALGAKMDATATMALILLSILPVIIFYLLCQKHIIKGVAAGAVKG